jgi:RNA polymerase sigma factor (sigma-70 family)
MSLAVSATQIAPSCSEHELVAAVRHGDDRAFEELYSRYRQRISAYVHGMVGDHGRAEDITQDVFISALRRMRESERPIAFKPWIYEIAKNACIDDFRRVRRAREVPIGDDELERDNPRLLGRTPTPDVAIENRQHLTHLRGAFRGLSDSHHQIIVLRELEGLSYAEIGERMGMTRPVVESTLFRARRRLSDEYDELVSGRRCTHVQAVITERGPRAFRSLGIKQRRLIARHLAHCQPCRRHAYLHGFDISAMPTPTVVGKIAALLPIPAIFRFRPGAGGAGTGSRIGRAVAAARMRAFEAVQSAQSASAYVDPSAPAGGISRVAAAAATLAIAGAGGGIIAATSGSAPHRPAGIVRTGATGAGATAATAGRSGHAANASASTTLNSATRTVAPTRGARGTHGPAAATANTGSGSGAGGQAGAAGQAGSAGTATHGGSQTAGSSTRSAGSGVTGGGSVTSGASNVVNSVLNGVPRVNLPTLPRVTLPTVTVPTLPTNLDGGSGSGSPVRLPNPTTVVQKVLHGIGLP